MIHMSQNTDVRTRSPEEICLAEIWTLMQTYRTGGTLSHDELVTLREFLPCKDVMIATCVTSEELLDIRCQAYLTSED